MKKKPPGEKSIVTGVSLPPDLHAWVTARANEASDDPTTKRSASAIVQQALVEYRARLEAANPPTGKAKSTTAKNAMISGTRAGAKTIIPSASSGTLSSMAGTDLSLRAG